MNKTFKTVMAILAAALAGAVEAQVRIDGVGLAKQSVQINVQNRAFANGLRRNLELSGLFKVEATGSVKVSGASGALRAEGAGKSVTSAETFADDKSARMAARKLSDAMVAAWSNGEQKGFACDRITFVNRKGANDGDLCMCYPDGLDIRRLTADNAGTVGPRWKDANTILYTSLKSGPQVWEYDVPAEKRRVKWSLKGLTTGAAVSPDGRRIAIILSFQGNPELYILDGNNYTRLTNTPKASEGCPSWSPDGKKIVYVSDETRSQQLFVVDVATKQSRRLTSRGRANVEPDWGRDGRIVYVSGGVVKVVKPALGDAQAEVVTQDGGWKHPSWSRDGRHVVAANGKSLFVLDTMTDQDGNREGPKGLFSAPGNWGDPSWYK